MENLVTNRNFYIRNGIHFPLQLFNSSQHNKSCIGLRSQDQKLQKFTCNEIILPQQWPTTQKTSPTSYTLSSFLNTHTIIVVFLSLLFLLILVMLLLPKSLISFIKHYKREPRYCSSFIMTTIIIYYSLDFKCTSEAILKETDNP